MRNFSQHILHEEKEKTVVFTFGRMNPPSLGHEYLIQRLKQISKDSGTKHAYVFLSQSQDSDKNPLSFLEKHVLLSRTYPFVEFPKEKKINNPFAAFEYLYKKGFTRFIFVSGADREKEFRQRFDDMVKRQKMTNVDSFLVISVGARKGESDIENASATILRKAARENDFKTFKKYSPSQFRDLERYFKLVQSKL